MKTEEEYFVLLEDLKWDTSYLKKFCQELDPESWYEFSCGGIRWTMREDSLSKRTECTNFKKTTFFKELGNLFNYPLNKADIFFTKTPPPGIPPHVDRNRAVAINIPVLGKLSDSPMVWFDSFDKKNIVAECNHLHNGNPTAVLFDPSKIHGVLNDDDNERCLLSIWWRDITFSEALSEHKKGKFLNKDFIKECHYFSCGTN